MPACQKYRIRFCCSTCAKWDVITLPDHYCVDRHDSWDAALQQVKKLQLDQIRAQNRSVWAAALGVPPSMVAGSGPISWGEAPIRTILNPITNGPTTE